MNQPIQPDEPTGEYQRPDLATVVAEVVLPVLRRLARPGEVDDLSIGWNADGLGLRITMRGELFGEYLWADDLPWSPVEARERLASNLQDFIAESRFGWGELREFDDS